MIVDQSPPLRALRPRPRRLGSCFLLGAVALLAARAGVMAEGSAAMPAGARSVIVAPGQSLWDIAEEQLPNDDPRHAVAEIIKLNGLRSAVLQPGDVLSLPAH